MPPQSQPDSCTGGGCGNSGETFSCAATEPRFGSQGSGSFQAGLKK